MRRPHAVGCSLTSKNGMMRFVLYFIARTAQRAKVRHILGGLICYIVLSYTVLSPPFSHSIFVYALPRYMRLKLNYPRPILTSIYRTFEELPAPDDALAGAAGLLPFALLELPGSGVALPALDGLASGALVAVFFFHFALA